MYKDSSKCFFTYTCKVIKFLPVHGESKAFLFTQALPIQVLEPTSLPVHIEFYTHLPIQKLDFFYIKARNLKLYSSCMYMIVLGIASNFHGRLFVHISER